MIPNQPAQRFGHQPVVQNAIAAVLRAIETPAQPNDAVAPTARESTMVAISELETKNPRPQGDVPRETVQGEITSQEMQRPQPAPRLEPREAVAFAERKPMLHVDPPARPEEPSILQVHIGQVEVRVAAPAPAPVPAPAKPQVRRGFAEYEAVRRYNTRNRM
jgi:hypothetical protein